MLDVKILSKKLKGKLCFVDIETSPCIALTWGCGKQVISHKQIMEGTRVISICYMAEGDKEPQALKWDANQSDTKMLSKFREIVKSYDVIIAQNGDRFDLPTLNGRAWQEGTEPYTNLITLDTLKMSRGSMRLPSHSLDYRRKCQGSKGKLPTDFDLWVEVFYKNNRQELDYMVEYNKVDVTELREDFWSILPYIEPKKIPVALGKILNPDRNSCSMCGNMDIKTNGWYATKHGIRDKCWCTKCNHQWNETRINR